jgi:hypothetical protein
MLLRTVANMDIFSRNELLELSIINFCCSSNNDDPFVQEIVNKIESKEFFFAFSFDFRGRLYFESPISPTFNKMARLFLFYGFYSEEEIESFKNLSEINKTTEIINEYKQSIGEFMELFNIENNNNNNNNNNLLKINKIEEMVF